jgi:hypothetical protein
VGVKMSYVLLFIIGVFIGNVNEYLVHKYILHGLGKNKKSFFSSHWHRHHKAARKYNFYDQNYTNIKNTKIEIAQLILLSILYLPLFYFYPPIYLGIFFNGILYFILHRYMHLNPQKAKRFFPWHWEHHMGKDQDKNWCVTLPITDFTLSFISKLTRYNTKSK